MSSEPKPNFEKEKHERLCHDDSQVRGEICSSLLDTLEMMLGQANPAVEKETVAESAEDALLDYLSRPERFDLGRGVPLLSWLAIQARGHLSNKLRQKKSRQRHERLVGVWDENFESFLSETSLEKTIYQGKDENALEEERQILDELMMRLSPGDRAEIELLRWEGSFEEWVQLLGIGNQPVAAQCEKVNAEKDRLKIKLKRWARKMQGGDNCLVDLPRALWLTSVIAKEEESCGASRNYRAWPC